MSDLSKSNNNHGKLLAQSILLANKVIDELSQTVEINQRQISDLYQKNEFVSHVAKQNQDEIRKFKEAEGYIEAVRLCSLVDWPTDEGFTSTIGKELTTLSSVLGYEKKTRPHPRYKKGIGQYHPVVCKKYLQKKNTFIPKELKYIIE